MHTGIDLGTTKSIIGYCKGGVPLIIPFDDSSVSIASSVLITHNNKIFVGKSALNNNLRFDNKNLYIPSVKELIRKQCEITSDFGSWYPQEIVALTLSELKQRAEQYIGELVDRSVIVIPTYYNLHQRTIVREAAELSDITASKLLGESVAALIPYAYNKRETENVLVFCIGGGNLDIAVAEIGDNVIEVKSVIGEGDLGGNYLDQIIVKHILEELEKKYQIPIELDYTKQIYLRDIVEKTKVFLISSQSTEINIPGFLSINNSRQDLLYNLSRSIFEKLSEILLIRAKKLLDLTLKNANLSVSDIDKILLLGGCSNIPFLKRFVSFYFTKTPVKGVNPITGVAQGASLISGIYSGNIKDLLILDIIPFSIGIEINNGKYHKIIEHNTTLPTKKSILLSTGLNNQKSILLNIYQGEDDITANNTYLGSIHLTDIPSAKEGTPRLRVSIDVDVVRRMNASVEILANGKKHEINLTSLKESSEEQFNKMKQRLQKSIRN